MTRSASSTPARNFLGVLMLPVAVVVLVKTPFWDRITADGVSGRAAQVAALTAIVAGVAIAATLRFVAQARNTIAACSGLVIAAAVFVALLSSPAVTTRIDKVITPFVGSGQVHQGRG